MLFKLLFLNEIKLFYYFFYLIDKHIMSFHKINRFFILCAFFLVFSACSTRKNMVYFQGDSTFSSSDVSYSPKIQPDDFLSITIYGGDELNSKPFNLPDVTLQTTKGYTNGIAAEKGYLVNELGEIDLPTIGTVKIGGLTRSEAAKIIKQKVSVYIQKPIVNIQIQNFKITVLGDVNIPGTKVIPNERITILEALGIAGDLNISAKRTNILVIREENGVKKEYRVDLTKKYFFNSPVYFLNQNDVVYVEPNRAKINSSNIGSAAGVFISVASLLITTINVLTK
jgi:polysaccharide export outer membrane protein